jgi:hypothetical protein
MKDDEIIEVGIDSIGSLYICPKTQAFSYIYRAAMDVRWDAERGRLFCLRPTEWSHVRQFAQILSAAASEYGIRFLLTPKTKWLVPGELRTEIESQKEPD